MAWLSIHSEWLEEVAGDNRARRPENKMLYRAPRPRPTRSPSSRPSCPEHICATAAPLTTWCWKHLVLIGRSRAHARQVGNSSGFHVGAGCWRVLGPHEVQHSARFTPMTNQKACQHCGQLLPADDAKFCPHCGTTIGLSTPRACPRCGKPNPVRPGSVRSAGPIWLSLLRLCQVVGRARRHLKPSRRGVRSRWADWAVCCSARCSVVGVAVSATLGTATTSAVATSRRWRRRRVIYAAGAAHQSAD